MRIAFGEDDDLTGLDRDRLFADNIGEAATFGNHMISDQMLGPRQDLRQDHLLRRRLSDPWCPGHDVKECRTSQPDRFQDIR
jgi:hypothetical protein